jgi:hypothetical protein
MISKEDCIALSGLSRAEVEAIAEHEHCGEVAAAALGNYLLHRRRGVETIRDMIVDDIRAAMAHGRVAHAKELFCALRQLFADHPEVRLVRH